MTKHRATFNLQLSPQDLLFLVNNLGSDPQSTEDQEQVTEWLKEIVRFMSDEYGYPVDNTRLTT